MIRRPPRSTQSRSSAASDVYKRQLFVHNAMAALALRRIGSHVFRANHYLMQVSYKGITMSDANGGEHRDGAAGASPIEGGIGPDPAELSRQMREIAEKSQRIVAEFLSRQNPQGAGVGMADPTAIGAAFFELTARMMADPGRLAGAQIALWQDYLTLWQRTTERLMGQPAEAVVEAAPDDRLG